jgi:hypothetical protein
MSRRSRKTIPALTSPGILCAQCICRNKIGTLRLPLRSSFREIIFYQPFKGCQEFSPDTGMKNRLPPGTISRGSPAYYRSRGENESPVTASTNRSLLARHCWESCPPFSPQGDQPQGKTLNSFIRFYLIQKRLYSRRRMLQPLKLLPL